MLALTACSSNKVDVDADIEKIRKSFGENDIVQAEYKRESNTICNPNYNNIPTTLREAYAEADITAVIKIVEYLGAIKNDEFNSSSGFKAKIVTRYKGKVKSGDEIYISQFGSPDGSTNQPLFKIGTMLLLNLKVCEEGYTYNNHPYYDIIGQNLGDTELINYNDQIYAIESIYTEDIGLVPISQKIYKDFSTYYIGLDELRSGCPNNVYLAKDLIAKISEMQ